MPPVRNMGKIFIVRGETGCGIERVAWNVCAYRSSGPAKEHAKAARAAVAHLDGKPHSVRCAASNPFDEHFQCDFEGTTYSVEPVGLRSVFRGPKSKVSRKPS